MSECRDLARLIAQALDAQAQEDGGLAGYVNADELGDAVIDGRFNLVALAEALRSAGYRIPRTPESTPMRPLSTEELRDWDNYDG